MRLGGPHDNERTLNGTSSDFDSVPAYGTVLSGPTDTSRNENDFLGQPFFMPYSTTVYADGLGGQTSVETWGLQYYPAGWVTATSQAVQTGTYSYTTQFEDYTPDGEFTWGYETLAHTEDGTGINYTVVLSETVTMQEGLVLASDTGGTGADRYRVVFAEAAVGRTELQDFTMHPVYGNILGYYSDDIIYTAACQNFTIGLNNGTQQANGYGGQFNSGGPAYNNASYLGHCGDYANGYQFYYHNGVGGVTEGNAPVGFQLHYESSSSSFAWSAPDGTNGNYDYATSETYYIADGNGGITYNSNSWNAPDGQEIYAGSYTSGQDESGNDIIQYFTVNFTTHESANGGGAYYSVNNV